MKKSLMAGLASALGTLVLAVTPMTSSAQTVGPDLDAVAFQSGVATTNVCWVLDMCGQPQTYTFSSTTCTYASLSQDGLSPVPDLETGGCSVTSGGAYINVVCGTGIVTGNATTIAEGGESDTYNVAGYTIVFAGGVGVLVAPSVTETGTDDTDTVPGVAAGVVDIAPNGLNLPPSQTGICTTGFSVTAVLVTNA